MIFQGIDAQELKALLVKDNHKLTFDVGSDIKIITAKAYIDKHRDRLIKLKGAMDDIGPRNPHFINLSKEIYGEVFSKQAIQIFLDKLNPTDFAAIVFGVGKRSDGDTTPILHVMLTKAIPDGVDKYKIPLLDQAGTNPNGVFGLEHGSACCTNINDAEKISEGILILS